MVLLFLFQAAIGAYYDFNSPQDKLPSMAFVRDVTIGEGESVPPNTTFVKTWRIQNNGRSLFCFFYYECISSETWYFNFKFLLEKKTWVSISDNVQSLGSWKIVKESVEKWVFPEFFAPQLSMSGQGISFLEFLTWEPALEHCVWSEIKMIFMKQLLQYIFNNN